MMSIILPVVMAFVVFGVVVFFFHKKQTKPSNTINRFRTNDQSEAITPLASFEISNLEYYILRSVAVIAFLLLGATLITKDMSYSIISPLLIFASYAYVIIKNKLR